MFQDSDFEIESHQDPATAGGSSSIRHEYVLLKPKPTGSPPYVLSSTSCKGAASRFANLLYKETGQVNFPELVIALIKEDGEIGKERSYSGFIEQLDEPRVVRRRGHGRKRSEYQVETKTVIKSLTYKPPEKITKKQAMYFAASGCKPCKRNIFIKNN